MVIEDVGYTEKKLKAIEEAKERAEELKKHKKLGDIFNEKARKLNIPYRIFITHGQYPHLFKIGTFLGFKNNSELNQIYWRKETDIYSFIDGLPLKVFNDIEKILNNIDIKFDINLKNGKIPNKYKILKELEK